MKGIRKFFKVTICAVLLGSLVAGCAGRVASATGSSAASPAASAEMAETTVVTTEEVSVKPVKIACGWSSIGEQELLQKQYYEEVLAPALNIDFIFSASLV